jgi:CRP/FNR family cyclic AMP-dependent transcriptional regulator
MRATKAMSCIACIKGSISIVLEDDECKEVVITYLNPGDSFGEMGLFKKTEERIACATRPVK